MVSRQVLCRPLPWTCTGRRAPSPSLPCPPDRAPKANCVLVSRSVGLATPPLAITLIQCAPLRSSSRAARRTCEAGTVRYSACAQQERNPEQAEQALHRQQQVRDGRAPRPELASGTPSQTRPMPRSAAPQAHQSSPLPRMSPWPPVWLSAWPEKSRRGPSTAPSSTACARPQSAPPASRTVVNPRLGALGDQEGRGV